MDSASATPTTNRQRYVDPAAQQIGRVYADALLNISEPLGQTLEVLEELEAVVNEVFTPHPDLEAFLIKVTLDWEHKAGTLERVFQGRVSDLTFKFLQVVGRRGRLDCLRAILSQARDEYDRRHHRVQVELTTVVPLEDPEKERFVQAIRAQWSIEPHLVCRTKPELLGGVQIRVGDTVYDGSLAAQLALVREKMLERSVHEIQTGRDRFSDRA